MSANTVDTIVICMGFACAGMIFICAIVLFVDVMINKVKEWRGKI